MWKRTNRINFRRNLYIEKMTTHPLAKKAAHLASLKTPESKLICVRENESFRSSFFLTPLSSNLYKRHQSFIDDFMKQNVQNEKSIAGDVKRGGGDSNQKHFYPWGFEEIRLTLTIDNQTTT